MNVTCSQFRCSNEILTIAAYVIGTKRIHAPQSVNCSFIDILIAMSDRFISQRKEADDAKAQFIHPDGDHLTLVSQSSPDSYAQTASILCIQLNVYHAYRTADCE